MSANFSIHSALVRAVSIVTALAVATTALFAVTATNPGQASAVNFTGTRNCDGNAVMYCGAMTVSELQSKYSQNASIQNIYNYFGISSGDIAAMGSTAQAGYVTKSGLVVVNGQTVATSALTAGREYISGSQQVNSNGTTFYTRAPSVSFLDNQLDAYVVMRNGQFAFAILPSCGNPVKATPSTPPVPPAPTPKPQPKPASLICSNLSVDKKSTQQYEFTINIDQQNAVVTSYNVDFGDNTNYTGTSNVVSHSYTSPGTYQIEASVTGQVNGQTITSSGNCNASITIPKPVPFCEQPQNQNSQECKPVITTTTAPTPPAPTKLVNTGPGETVGIFAAATVIAFIGSRLYLHRRYHA